ncbi:hypothetical protein L2E82_30704 [Cichorium intybus]|uniref:Uncharacterized protein n=1 Tax=Cichorium intybus TaxID=13427 RepID=A0ACB9D1E2_CICIN|nr:hypothetical protein L2E82_30704 [Cichorium intybus]
MTTGITGADLANLVKDATLLAGRQNKVVVERTDFIQAVERSIAGIEKKTAKLQGSEKAVVARHEAGHAVVGTADSKLLAGQPRVEVMESFKGTDSINGIGIRRNPFFLYQKLSILPRSGDLEGKADMKIRALEMVEELRTQRADKTNSVFASTISASEQPPPDHTSGYHFHGSHIWSSDQLSDQLLPLSNTYRRTTHPSNHHKSQVATGIPRWTNVSDSVRKLPQIEEPDHRLRHTCPTTASERRV